MGFYPVNPANGTFVFGSPLFDNITINLPDNKQFTLKALDNSDKNIYIQKITLNGKPYNHSYITYKDIINGGILILNMGPLPNKQFGAGTEDRPTSDIF